MNLCDYGNPYVPIILYIYIYTIYIYIYIYIYGERERDVIAYVCFILLGITHGF